VSNKQNENILAEWPTQSYKTVYVQPIKYKIKSYVTANTKSMETTLHLKLKTWWQPMTCLVEHIINQEFAT